MRINAPKGYTVTYRSGTYTVANKSHFVKLTFGRTPVALRPSANQIARGMKGKLSNVKLTNKKRTLNARITRGEQVYHLTLTRKGQQTNVQLFGRKPVAAKKKKGRVTARNLLRTPRAVVTTADVRRLRQILSTRRGGRVVPFNLTIPTRVFQAQAQNGASARVPNLPGWQYEGTDTGYLRGAHPTQGTFELGGYIFVELPQFATGQRASANFTTLPNAIAQVLPQWWHISSGGQSNITVTNIVPVANTQGALGTGYISESYMVSLTFNGQPWQGYFTVGAHDICGGGFAWCLYYSYIAVPNNALGGIGPALVNTWATWNNDAATAAGLNRALETIRTTPTAGPIDPEVFDRIHNKWVEYVRM